MEELVFRFLELAEELEANPEVDLVKFVTYQGASDADIEYCESILGVKLSQQVAEFFKVTNGMQLIWQPNDQSHTGFEEDEWIAGVKPPDYSADNVGVINIWPLNDIFDKDWSEDIYFESSRNTYSEFNGLRVSNYEIQKSLRPFDLYSRYNCFSFFCFGIQEVDKVLFSQDYYIDFSFAKPVSFKAYLEFLLITKGEISARDFFAGNEKFSKKLITHDAAAWKSVLDLDR